MSDIEDMQAIANELGTEMPRQGWQVEHNLDDVTPEIGR